MLLGVAESDGTADPPRDHPDLDGRRLRARPPARPRRACVSFPLHRITAATVIDDGDDARRADDGCSPRPLLWRVPAWAAIIVATALSVHGGPRSATWAGVTMAIAAIAAQFTDDVHAVARTSDRDRDRDRLRSGVRC